MKSNLLMDFSVDRENKSIIVKREFAAELPQVWDAFTNSEILDKWWAPKPWKAQTKSMDFTEGGHWHYAMVGPGGEKHWSYNTYEKIEPQKGFTAQDGFSDENGKPNTEMPQSKWITHFSSSNKGSLVIFEIKFDDTEQLEATMKMGFKEGLTSSMEGLDNYFATLNK